MQNFALCIFDLMQYISYYIFNILNNKLLVNALYFI